MKQQTWKKATQLACCAAVSGALLWPAGGAVLAAEEEYTLDEVVVTASKTPHKKMEVNANVTVISSADIEQNHYRSLSEALRSVPGVYIAEYGGGVGYEQSNSLYINGSNQIVVLVDGIKVNAAGVNFPASGFYSLNNIERIEVLKGSASTLYGSAAKGGVINIITKKVNHQETTLKMIGGSYDKETYSLTTQGKSGDYSWLVTSQKDLVGNYQDAQGLELKQHLNAETHSVKLAKAVNENADVSLQYDRYNSDFDYSDSNKKQNLNRHGVADTESWKIIHNYRFDDGATNQLSYFQNDYDTNYNKYLTHVQTVGVQEQFSKPLGEQHVLTGGFDFTQDKIVSMKDVKLTSRALYLQDEWKLDKAWTLSGGVRHDNHSSFGNHTTPSVKVGYKADDKTNYYVSYSEFFITPTPMQLYSAYGNPGLRPETGRTSEFGVQHSFDDSATAAFHVFRRHAADTVGFSYGTGKYANVEEENATGWDIQVDKSFSKQLKGHIGYTYTNIDATATRAKNVDGYIPRGAWDIGFNYQQPQYDVSLQGHGVVDRPGPQDAYAYRDFFPQTSYWVWNLALNYKVNANATAFIKVNNLFDTFYAEHSNATAKPYWNGNPGEWWTSPGRNYQMGMTYTF